MLRCCILRFQRDTTRPLVLFAEVAHSALEPTESWLADIANRRYRINARHTDIAKEVMALRKEAKAAGIRQPSTAEYLDAVIAAAQPEAEPTSPEWTDVKRALLWKSDASFPETAGQ